MNTKLTLGALSIVAILALSGCGSSSSSSNETTTPMTPTVTAISEMTDATQIAQTKQMALTAYADYAIDAYTATLADAKKLKTALEAFTTAPTAETMQGAKDAWLQSRETYGVTEILRLSEGPIDAEEGFAATFGAPEGQLNAWPLNESMIDYVTAKDGTTTTGNIIDGTGVFASFTSPTNETVNLGEAGDQTIDITTINVAMLKEFTQKDGDANVATGYHAIEFLLWGQDQDYKSIAEDQVTNGAMVAGERAISDYTNGSTEAERRKTYLLATADLIIEDLKLMTAAWDKTSGDYRKAFLGEGSNAINADTALTNVFKGMGVFLKSELAQERMSVAAFGPSEEDEHSCFSDNTHRDVVTNYKGFTDVLNTAFVPSLTSDAKTKIAAAITKVDAGVKQIDDVAKTTMHFDYQIQDATQTANVKATKNDMRDLADLMVMVAKEYGITITQEDVRDPEESADR